VKAPCGIEIAIGQKWREIDIHFMRKFKVVGMDETADRVQLTGVGGGWSFWEPLERFTGKYGGYTLVPPKTT